MNEILTCKTLYLQQNTKYILQKMETFIISPEDL